MYIFVPVTQLKRLWNFFLHAALGASAPQGPLLGGALFWPRGMPPIDVINALYRYVNRRNQATNQRTFSSPACRK